MLKLYNTLTRKIEEIPKKDHVNLYTCGPTVYNYAHIGNLRSYIVADLLYRTLKFDGYQPKWVMNITDIDDKTIKGAIVKYGKEATVKNLREFTEFYLDEFLKDLAEVNVLKDEITFIRVTDVIPQIQEFIIGLIDKGYAYKAEDGSTYFSIEKYQKDLGDYGSLVGHKFLEGKKVGARVKVDEYEKNNLSDFALWKAWDETSDAQIFWEHSHLGAGRPGWHIECSVINKIAFKGEPTDIHTGGVDLIFPHHTNEIAQSQALFGKGNFVKHWFHSEHLLVDGKKMAKSGGNFYTLKDLGQSFSGLSLRYLFLQAHYRTQQNFSRESLKSAFEGYYKVLAHFYALDVDIRDFVIAEGVFTALALAKLNEDLDVPGATAVLYSLLLPVNPLEESQGPQWLVFDELLGLKFKDIYLKHYENQELSPEARELKNQRELARQQKDFKKSDELRKQIEGLGYEVMDTAEGQKIKKKLQV